MWHLRANSQLKSLSYFDDPTQQVKEFTSKAQLNEFQVSFPKKSDTYNVTESPDYSGNTRWEQHIREVVKYFCREDSCKRGICSLCIELHSTHDFIIADKVAAFEIKSELKSSESLCKARMNSKSSLKSETLKLFDYLQEIKKDEHHRIKG